MTLLVKEPKSTVMDNNMENIIQEIKLISGLRNVNGGYWKVDNEMLNDPFGFKLGGFNRDIIENSLSSSNKSLYLCFIAVPIDADSFNDNLIENPSLSDWDFEETYVKPVVGTTTISVGAITKNGIKYRTIKFLADLNN